MERCLWRLVARGIRNFHRLVVIRNGADPTEVRINNRRPHGTRQVDEERLVGLHGRVAHDIDRHQLARLPCCER